jgi:hypothetical protein
MSAVECGVERHYSDGEINRLEGVQLRNTRTSLNRPVPELVNMSRKFTDIWGLFSRIIGGKSSLRSVYGRGIKGRPARLNFEDDCRVSTFHSFLLKMPAKNWTTPEQLTWFEAQIPDFLKAQAERQTVRFYTTVTHEFFSRWSERALRFPPITEGTTRTLTATENLLLTSFIVRRKAVRYERYHAIKMYILTSALIQQIRSWFPWHSKAHSRKQPNLASLQSFGQSNQKTRLRQASEVYSTLYYDTKIKARVVQEKGDRTLSRAENLSLIKKITQEMYAAETPEVKEQVVKRVRELKEMRAKDQADEHGDNEDGTRPERRPEEYQQYVLIHSVCTLYLHPTPPERFKISYHCLDQSWMRSHGRPATFSW